MKRNWAMKSVEEISERVAMGPFGSSIKVSTFVDQGIPVISGQHLKESQLVDGENNFITEKHARNLEKANVFPGDVIFTHAGNIGQVAYIPDSARYKRYVISQRQFYCRPDLSQVLPQWIAAYFRSPDGRHSLLSNASSTGVPSIARPVTHLRSIKIPVPPLTEQKAITSILEVIEEKIQLNRQTARTLEELAQRLFKSWFVDFDPVRAKMAGRQPLHMPPETAALFPDKLVESPLGPMPEDWDVGELSDVAEQVRDSVKADEIQDDSLYVGLEHFAPKHLILADTGRGEEVSSNKSRFHKGDLLFGKLRPYFHKVAVAHADGICSTDILVIRPKYEESRAFCYLAFFQEAVVNYATQRSTGTRMPRANWKTLSEYPIAVPPVTVRRKFDSLALPIIDRLFLLRRESGALAELRDRLLPKLVRGEIRVVEAPN